jgi:YcaO-like protein with predicted kinase domain
VAGRGPGSCPATGTQGDRLSRNSHVAVPAVEAEPSGKTFHTGTHRAATPEATWALIERVRPAVGITRVADITGLDVVGIPVALAFRPLGRTLAVSAGKGYTPLLAKVSAAMEAIELWHAEHPDPPAVITDADSLGLPYDPGALAQTRPSAWSPRVRCGWRTAKTLDAQQLMTWLPDEAVTLSSVVKPGEWALPGLLRTSNGLASGNTLAEAILHGLLELVERDALADLHQGRPPRAVAYPTGLPVVDDLCSQLLKASVEFRLLRLENRFALPCYQAAIRDVRIPLTFTGAGCHTAADVAMARAITEAAQNRAGVIAGSRDDLDLRVFSWQSEEDRDSRAGLLSALGGDPSECTGGGGLAADSHDEDIQLVSDRVRAVTGQPVLWADLTKPGLAIPVARVVAPGLRFDARTAFAGQTAGGSSPS